MAAKMYNSINQNNMLRLITDEANERQPQLARVSKTKVRVYINHREEERESTEGDEKHTVYIADFIEVETTSNDPLEIAKQAVSEAILAYDSSEVVNQFSINGSPMWLDKATRAGLKLRLEAERSAGKESTTLWYGTEAITLPVANAIVMLNRLEIYASESYDVTQGHLARVALMESVEEVLGYDYTEGYPEKLNF